MRMIVCALAMCLTGTIAFASDGPTLVPGNGLTSATQAIVNPTGVAFTPSADDGQVDHGVPVVSSYALNVYKLDGVTLVKSQDLGHPLPDATNTINVNIASALSSVTVGDYVVKIAAVGPSGSGETAASDPFTLSPRKPAAPAGKPVIK